MTEPRPAIPYATLALGRRTVARKALLAPWDRRVARLWNYLVAWSAQRNHVMVSHSVLAVNHHHSVVTPKGRNIAEYEQDLHGFFARGLNALLKERGYEPIGQVWDNQQPLRMRLMDSAASMSQHVYDRMQNVAAGFVDRPNLMPGYDFNREFWRPGNALVRKMPKIKGFSETGWSEAKIQYQPEPALIAQFGGNYSELIQHLNALEELAKKKILATAEQAGLTLRGAGSARRMHPFDEPKTAARKQGPAPTFRIGAAGVSCPEKRKRGRHAWHERRAFVSQNREAYETYRDVDEKVLFPYGTDKMVRGIDAQMKPEPEPDAYWMAPGPSLDEVYRQLALDRPRGVDEVMAECAHVIETEASGFKESVDASYAARNRTPNAQTTSHRAPMRLASTHHGAKSSDVDAKNPTGEAIHLTRTERAKGVDAAAPRTERPERDHQGTEPKEEHDDIANRNTGRRASDPPDR